MVLGHESAGVVVEVGDKVRHLKPGDRVAMEPGVPCRRCDYCRSGSYNLCGDTIFAATPPWDGTLAKYYINAADFCYKVPDHMTLEEAAMVEPVSVAVAIAKTANLQAHQTVLVLGCGPIGVLCQAVAKAAGARTIIGVDVIPSRLEVAKSYGIDHTFMPSRAEPGADPMVHAERVATQLKEELGLGEGADVVLECSGAELCADGYLRSPPGSHICAGWHGQGEHSVSHYGGVHAWVDNQGIHSVSDRVLSGGY